MSIIGLDAFGINAFKSYSPPVRNIRHVTMKNAIYDEIHIREKTVGIDLSNTKEDWQMDTILLAKFLGDLEAGNVNNQGIQIGKFAIKRRKLNEINSVTLGYKDFVNNNQFVYEDYTQPNDDFIYSIVPVGENELEGQENSIEISSNFAGFFLVDKDSNEVLGFDSYIGSEPTVSVGLTQGRVQIDTLSKYPSFFYTEQSYNSFSLQAVLMPEEWERIGQKYDAILKQFVYSHKPFLAKGGDGSFYVVDVHSPVKEVPMNVYKGREYITVTLQCTETMDYETYMSL